jgi:hypothetical protein
LEGVVDVAEVFGDRAGGFEVQQRVDAAAGPGCVALADDRAQVPILDGQGYQPARPSGDVPGQ